MLRTDIKTGLSEKEVFARQKEFGKNVLPEEKRLSKFEIFLEQFKSPLIYILAVAGVVAFVLGEYADAIVIFGAVFVNTIVGFLQENKASQTLRALKQMVKHTAKVLRDGNIKIINSNELIPGDIVMLNPGDRVPADGRIFIQRDLKINEMALTGEWLAAEKTNEILAEETPLADRDNMVYMGTVVEEGRGTIVVTEGGIKTEIGRVASMVKETAEEKTPYQKKLFRFSKIIGVVVVFICFGIFIEGIITGGDAIEMFIIAVAVAVAAIPEGLPIAMTVILALGMQRILKKKGLVRKLTSAETLGGTSVIATDKTATLTEGRMKVDMVVGERILALKAATLTSEAFIENPDEPKEKWILRGRPTERALLEAGIEAGIDGHREFEKRKIADIPFDTANKFAAAVYEEDNGKMLYVCGAPEKIIEMCVLDLQAKENLEKKLREFARKGLRIVASACKELGDNSILKTQDFSKKEKISELLVKQEISNLSFAGLIILKDPIRKDVKSAMEVCRRAGMRPIIITGDHKLTAQAVAEELGFRVKDKNILEGKELDNISQDEFVKRVEEIQVYARVEPRHKTRVIRAWQEKGDVVAMTGDGINDAPALKKADVGVALGSGTEVAKETADLILLNDSFSIIVAAVEEGRAIIDNIRKVITFLLSDSFTEVILIGASVLGGFPLPLTALQILWINLIEDGLPNIALAFEPKEKDLMNQNPQPANAPLLTKEMKVLIFIIGILTDLFLLGLFFWLWNKNHDIDYVRTMVFACLSIDSIFYVFSCKSLRRNIWHINPFSNKFLVISWFISVLMLFASIYLSPLQTILKTIPLDLNDWLVVFALGTINIVLIEITKWYFIVRKQCYS